MQTGQHRNDLPVARELIKFRHSQFEGECEYIGQYFLQTLLKCFCRCLSSLPLAQATSCLFTQFMPLHPNGPSPYSRPSPSFHCFQFSLFSQSQPPLFFSCLSIHLLFASSLVHLNWISPHSISQHCFSPLVTCTYWGPYFTPPHTPHIWIRKLSPPHYWGTRKRSWTQELFSIPFSLPAAAPSSAHSGSGHNHRRCFPTRHRLRCFTGMEHAHEDIARAGRWPVRKISSGDLNSKRTCKFLPQICAKCRFHGPYNMIKPEEIFHRDGKEPSLIEKQPFPTVFWISATKQRETWKWEH